MSWKLAVLGTGTTLRRAPLTDPSFTFWGVVTLVGVVPKLDRVVEMNFPTVLEKVGLWPKVVDCPCPIYMADRYEGVTRGERYPIEFVRQKLMPIGRTKPFLTSNVSYMLALALLPDPPPSELHLFGVDMVQGTEYEEQRSACEFFLGVFVGRGVKVVLQPESAVLNTKYLYGLEEEARAADVATLRERSRWFQVQQNTLLTQLQQVTTQLVHTNAVLSDTAHHWHRADT